MKIKQKTPEQIYGNSAGGGPSDLVLTHICNIREDIKILFEQGIKILDVGCGQGHTCDYIKTNFQKNFLVGCDISDIAIQKAREKNLVDDIFKCDISFEKIPYADDSFDVIFLLDTLEHISNPHHAVSEIKRVCKDNVGKIIISIPDEEQQQGYRANNHAFVYPGLFHLKNFIVFLQQSYLGIVYYKKFINKKTFHGDYSSGSMIRREPIHHVFLCENTPIKNDYDILNVIHMNLEPKDLEYPKNDINEFQDKETK